MDRCRLCAAIITNQKDDTNFNNSVSRGESTVDVNDMLKIFRNLQNSSYLLPNIACTSCLKDLEFCYKFYAKVLRSTSSLLEQYDSKRKRFREIAPKPKDCIASQDHAKHSRLSKRQYTCEECSTTFKSHRQLVSHHQIHEPENVCHYCGTLYFDIEDLRLHVRTKHEDLKYLCGACNKRFPSRNLLLRHRRKLHNSTQRQYHCTLCNVANEGLVGKNKVEIHIKEFHPRVEIRTEDSKISANQENEIEPDMIEEFLDYMDEEFLDDFLLNQDQNSFCWDELSLTHFDEDLRTPTPCLNTLKEGTYRCPRCDEFFIAQKNLIQHLAHVHGEYTLYCNTCGLAFNRFSKLKEHCNNHMKHSRPHANDNQYDDTSLHCSACNKTFKTPLGLKYHVKTHSDAKPFTCPYCQKAFVANINLNAHIRNVHADIKPNLCTLCDRKFASVDHLKKHVSSVHQKERHHLCSICGKSFSQATHLKQHSLIHTGQKPFKCNVCTLSFHKKTDVVKHGESHSTRSQEDRGNCLDDAKARIESRPLSRSCFQDNQLPSRNEIL